MRFFKPTPAFMHWIAQASRRRRLPVVDCGCGDGDLVRELNAAGLKAIGIDPRYVIFNEAVPEDLSARILPEAAEASGLVRDTRAILLVCRPCHSGFPVDINAARNPESPFFYVGLARNIDRDLGSTPIELVLDNAGEDGEKVWRVSKVDQALAPVGSFAPLAVVLAEAEGNHIRAVLESCRRVKDAARVLGIGEHTLRDKRRKHGLSIRRTSLGKLQS